MNFIKFLKSKSFIISLCISLILVVLIFLGVTKFLHSYTNQDQKIEVPNLIGLTVDEVKVVLDDRKLDYELLETGSYNPNIPKEAVLEQLPVAGQIVKEKRKIYITINPDGYANAPIPPFYGRTKKEIEQLIINSGFKVGQYEEIDDIGTVVRKLKFKGQELKSGDQLPKMSVIDVIIGNGQLR
ncbi:PASTA domain-containing protein [Wenyingzhuangia sp. chi5]|uniref:PASTA domain-containing protein n=1 Tax=Wenyingzhuangia gilva TaxID=3057677 RepID=A0ABT8VUH9_9FLAO|nr:PASTA domain-containing protein [Wenyingzhuangia sp. chi5]MDO3695575.1 PASTA domain-containing protein [Wenyingzhuangia sp. chi5]